VKALRSLTRMSIERNGSRSVMPALAGMLY
jgi:hypothetical protein